MYQPRYIIAVEIQSIFKYGVLAAAGIARHQIKARAGQTAKLWAYDWDLSLGLYANMAQSLGRNAWMIWSPLKMIPLHQ